jgi:Domain of unknown function (DUF4394)
MTRIAPFAITRRPRIAAGALALAASALVAPGGGEATERFCGRVFVINTQNELLRLPRSAQLLDDRDESPGRGEKRVRIRERAFVGGLASGESLIGIDFRPANGVLYGVGRIGGDPMGQLYTIDTDHALASAVGPRAIPLAGQAFGFDFNPVPDRLRIVSDTGMNIRVNPDTGAVAGVDTSPLAYPAAGDPNSGRTASVVAVAYTNPDRDGQTNTVLHDIDAARGADADRSGDGLAIQVPPNAGVLNTIGSLGVDAGGLTAFDIGPFNEGLAAIQPVGAASSRLYAIDLASGLATSLGLIGSAESVVGLAIGLGPQCD